MLTAVTGVFDRVPTLVNGISHFGIAFSTARAWCPPPLHDHGYRTALDKVVHVDQSPPKVKNASNLSIYTVNQIRKLPKHWEAKVRLRSDALNVKADAVSPV